MHTYDIFDFIARHWIALTVLVTWLNYELCCWIIDRGVNKKCDNK